MSNKAILGGTFDPIHNGHLHVALAVKEAFNPEQIIFIPTGSQALKQNTESNKHHRLEMVKIAIAPYEEFTFSDIEIAREGTTYTVDTLETLALQGCNDPYFIIGEDVLKGIFKWKETNKLFKLCRFILVNRPNSFVDQDIQNIIGVMRSQGAVVHLLTIPALDISAENIRYRVNTNKHITQLVPETVAKYIAQNNLYKEKIPFDFEKATAILKKNLTQERYDHVMGVCEEAVKLAKHYKQCPHRAHIAALLHDLTKEYTPQENEAAFEKYNFTPDQFMEMGMGVCHGFLAAEIAKKDFLVQCKDTLNSIRYHTTGRPQMTMLEKVVFIADAIEPTRGDSPYLETLRKQAYQDINKAMHTCLSHSLSKAQKKGAVFHPFGINALKEYETCL
ncbi:MAG: nicotinate-nucleotide adenylyltransferase [Defluviitaleaceae bacterium]|nr:nicotinate-nucleotide adenylyltransferase [Defluviitaleaceae bacterium]